MASLFKINPLFGQVLAYGLKSARHRPWPQVTSGALVALFVAVLAGSLQVGDSLVMGLKNAQTARLGPVVQSMQTARAFPATWARGVPAALALWGLKGQILVDGQGARPVQVWGVDRSFFSLTKTPVLPYPCEKGAGALGKRAAEALGLSVGDSLTLRLDKPQALPLDGPMGPRKVSAATLELRVAAILGDDQWGRFDLNPGAPAPLNFFVNRDDLADALDAPGMANTLILTEALKPEAFANRLKNIWEPEDFGLYFKGPDGDLFLNSRQVFFSKDLSAAVEKLFPQAHALRTTLLKEILGGMAPLPYLVGSSESGAPVGPGRNEIFLDDDLFARSGLALGKPAATVFWVWGPSRQLETQTQSFTVAGTFRRGGPMAGPHLFPAFPGLDVGSSCQKWDPGLPLDLTAVGPWHEDHWRRFGGSPRVLFHADDLTKWGADPSGQPTGYRLGAVGLAEARDLLRSRLNPSDGGFFLKNVGDGLGGNSKPSSDFPGLFAGLSLFIPAVAVLLLSLTGGLRHRENSRERGLLYALGFSPRATWALLFSKEIWALVLGIFFGNLASLAWGWALTGVMGRQVGGAFVGIPLHFTPGALRLFEASALAVLVAGALEAAHLFRENRAKKKEGLGLSGSALSKKWLVPLAALFLGLSAWAIFLGTRGFGALGAFATGAAVLALGILAQTFMLTGPHTRARSKPKLSHWLVTVKAKRHHGFSSLVTTGALATGLFLCLSLGVFEALLSPGGTGLTGAAGGFSHIIRLSSPWVPNLGVQRAPQVPPFVALRRVDGEDASCLNPNQATSPALLGLPLEAMKGRFSFTQAGANWETLRDDGGPLLRVAVDASVLEWQLGRHLGETFIWTSPSGRSLNVQLVATLADSVFQGHLLADEKALLRLLPETDGPLWFLVDGQLPQRDQQISLWKAALRSKGPLVETTQSRLATFSQVARQYLVHFQGLSALALMLAIVGFLLLAWKQFQVRKEERRLTRALGFNPWHGAWLALAPVLFDLAWGIGAAVMSYSALQAAGQNLGPTWPPWSVWAPLALGLTITLGALFLMARHIAKEAEGKVP